MIDRRHEASPRQPRQTGSGPGRRGVVLLSGGLDSTTAAAWALNEGWRLSAISVDYGQRHAVELDSARKVATALGISDHLTLQIDLAAFGGSGLTDPSIGIPKHRDEAAIGGGIPVTYVPARNIVLLSLALAMAETRHATGIVIGVNAIDYSGYPDCREEFIEAFARAARLATKAGVEGAAIEIVTPLQRLTKTEIIRLGLDLGVDYGLTTSCYDPAADGRPCGACDACTLRAVGFAEAGCRDPLETAYDR